MTPIQMFANEDNLDELMDTEFKRSIMVLEYWCV